MLLRIYVLSFWSSGVRVLLFASRVSVFCFVASSVLVVLRFVLISSGDCNVNWFVIVLFEIG